MYLLYVSNERQSHKGLNWAGLNKNTKNNSEHVPVLHEAKLSVLIYSFFKIILFMESLVRDNRISYFINERGLGDLQGLQILLLNLLSSLSFASCEME